jgi:hypothetical protein
MGEVKGIGVDINENSYIFGWFVGSITFDSNTITSIGYNDIFIAKVDMNGIWQWARRAGANIIDFCTNGYDICVDDNGNSYVTGDFEGTVFFDSIPLTSIGFFDSFIAKVDTNGNWQWAINAGGSTASAHSYSICLDVNNNLYITGSFTGTISLGGAIFNSIGNSDVYVAKLDVNGNWQWAIKAGGVDSDSGRNICVDNNGNSYVTGFFSDTATFGSTTLGSNGNYDIFVGCIVEENGQPKVNDIIYHEDYGNSIWRMQSDGSGQIQITQFGWFAKYSPDYQKIAFCEYYNNGIWICDANGGGLIKITDEGTHPYWSPNSNQICYHVGDSIGADRRIWIVDVNGANPHKISDNPGSFPEWSPDGNWITYHGEVGTGIWLIEPSGANDHQVYEDGGYPTWSPNGDWIAYQRFSDECIWKMKAFTGTDHVKLSEFPGIHPDWCPTNHYIAYETKEGQTWKGIRAVKNDGTDDQDIYYSGHAPDWGLGLIQNNPPMTPTWEFDKYNEDIIVSTIDPDGHNVKFGIDWNVNRIVDDWTIYVNSGEEIRINCSGRDGKVGIIAEDEHGAQSDWVSAESEIKFFTNIIFSRFQGKYSYLFLLLKKQLKF